MTNIELKMPPPQYTIKTLDALRQREPENDFTFVMGADNLENIHRWRDFQRILSDYGVAVYPRKGYDHEAIKRKLIEECRHFPAPYVLDANEFAEEGQRSLEETLRDIDNVGPVMAGDYVRFFADEANKAEIADLLSLLTIDESYEAAGTSLEGKTFVITGSLEHYANRKDLKAEIEAEGGKVAGSVSSKTDYLITNDPNSGSSKNRTARELGVAIITEEDIINMLK